MNLLDEKMDVLIEKACVEQGLAHLTYRKS